MHRKDLHFHSFTTKATEPSVDLMIIILSGDVMALLSLNLQGDKNSVKTVPFTASIKQHNGSFAVPCCQLSKHLLHCSFRLPGQCCFKSHTLQMLKMFLTVLNTENISAEVPENPF